MCFDSSIFFSVTQKGLPLLPSTCISFLTYHPDSEDSEDQFYQPSNLHMAGVKEICCDSYAQGGRVENALTTLACTDV